MGNLAEAYVDVIVDEKGLDSGLSQAHSKISGFVSSSQGLLGGLTATFAAVGAGAAVIGMALFEAAKKASDLGESLSKVRVTFGASASGMIAQADDLAKRFGVVKRESLDAAASFGLMGLAAGQSKTAAAELGNSLVKVGLDAASYFNVSNEDAFLRIRSGLAGESEPLRAFGVLLSEDAVHAEALAMGLVRTVAQAKHLTEQQKVAARSSLIVKGLKVSSGDLERTQDSAANQLRKLQGEIENLTAELGEKLVPALKVGIETVHELGKAFEQSFGTAPIDAFADALTHAMYTAKALAGGDPDTKRLLDIAKFAVAPRQVIADNFFKREDIERFAGLRPPGWKSAREKAAEKIPGIPASEPPKPLNIKPPGAPPLPPTRDEDYNRIQNLRDMIGPKPERELIPAPHDLRWLQIEDIKRRHPDSVYQQNLEIYAEGRDRRTGRRRGLEPIQITPELKKQAVGTIRDFLFGDRERLMADARERGDMDDRKAIVRQQGREIGAKLQGPLAAGASLLFGNNETRLNAFAPAMAQAWKGAQTLGEAAGINFSNKEHKPSQMYSDIADYSREGITGALDGADKAEQLLKVQEAAQKDLGEMKNQLGQIVTNTAKAFGWQLP